MVLVRFLVKTSCWFVFLLFLSCKSSIDKDEVLSQFENDSVKYKGAQYILSELPNRYTSTSEAHKQYELWVDSIYTSDLEVSVQKKMIKERLKTLKYLPLRKEYDDENVSSDFLTKHIDEAFKYYKSSWNNYLTDEEYFEYVLPYRIDDEILEDWQTLFRNEYGWVLDSLLLVNQNPTAYDLFFALNKELEKTKENFVKVFPFTQGVSPSVLYHATCGDCINYCNLGCFVMRSFGLPVVTDGNPNSHTWNVLITSDSLVQFNTRGTFVNGSFHVQDWTKYNCWKNVPKIWRKTFAENPNSLAKIKGHESIPEFFEDAHYIDVTNQYYKGIDVEIQMKNKSRKDFAYLAVHNCGFMYYDWSKIENDKVKFFNISDSIVYFPSYYYADRYVPFSYPFVFLTDNDTIYHEFVPNKNQLQNMTLYRKYHERFKHNIYLERAVGGIFVGSNSPDFETQDTLFVIKEMPRMRWTNIKIDNDKAYRYVRYLGPEWSYCSVAEIEFKEKGTNNLLKGTVLGTDGWYVESEGCTKDKVFDGDVLTFFDAPYPDGTWVGLDLGEAKRIGEIRYIMRNDDNFVQKGQEYELLYMDIDGWQSMGRKIADADSIIYENVPSEAIYLLKNRTKGREERVFSYENDKQIWW